VAYRVEADASSPEVALHGLREFYDQLPPEGEEAFGYPVMLYLLGMLSEEELRAHEEWPDFTILLGESY
jgi:hypothetical protein